MKRCVGRSLTSRRFLNFFLLFVILILTGLLLLERNQCLVLTWREDEKLISATVRPQLSGSEFPPTSETKVPEHLRKPHHVFEPDRDETVERDDFTDTLVFNAGQVDGQSRMTKEQADDNYNRRPSAWSDDVAASHLRTDVSSRDLVLTPVELVQNMSKFTGSNDWFRALEMESYLKNNQSFFTNRLTVDNQLNHAFLIKGKKMCQGEDPYLLIIIPSVISHADRRDVIRRTWLGAAESNQWPGASVRGGIKHIFLFGHQGQNVHNDLRSLITESLVYGDIVMADFVDSYRNLTRKMLVGFQWMLHYCHQAQFVLKVDEDTFVNAPLMVELLRHVSENADTDNFVLGLKHSYPKPKVMRKGRWGVSELEYPMSYFPHYMYGHTYAISKKGVHHLLSHVNYLRLIAPEDAFITGILPLAAGMARLTAPSFTVCCRAIYDCEVIWNQRVALTSLNTVSLIENLWVRVVTQSCDKYQPFIHFRSRKARSR